MLVPLADDRGGMSVKVPVFAGMALDQTQIVGVKINPPSDYTWGRGWDTGAERALHGVGVAAWQKNGDTSSSSTLFVLPDARMALMISGYAGFTPAALAEDILLRALVEDGTIAALPAQVGTTQAVPAAAPAMAGAAGSTPVAIRSCRWASTRTRSRWTSGRTPAGCRMPTARSGTAATAGGGA
ncbi:hypothetical protein [Burkholderia pyrrocinia]|uniref:hypothetical protein n=1 Tax=Burkholderia pyrrocinia TaxID=60550 RepID=UPI001BD13D4F|nr:hypothetical protein [Burkholderia pyrrocinia]QVN23600.1 hypothetical protein JYG32_34665 [Burkholderia pyrrocinia]